MPELILTTLLAALVVWARRQWKRAKSNEALDAELDARWEQIMQRAARIDAMSAAMERGRTDEHQCEVCTAVVPVRELVMLHDDAALCCLTCAEWLRPQKAGVRVVEGEG
ncbi:hypothetical protein GAU_1801 [Gemmatimonas aurantiaca T-27]|uniref:Uncharacterized protein n=1 Tax=Gemmatimonas aurantiaca (strain DSM 14586 / JCM 11422 / NBRC 100505 / T-27) TaxID=379066 RepID=C1A418_GEMAT|nr:hypothetical protein [Gemmatimonas aurantiaca]BAH38843.1 hypothetical protein GAU_1801 [Gemmatimonas aurantiaca T-27]